MATRQTNGKFVSWAARVVGVTVLALAGMGFNSLASQVKNNTERTFKMEAAAAAAEAAGTVEVRNIREDIKEIKDELKVIKKLLLEQR